LRWKGIIFIGLFSVVLFALFYFLGDSWIEEKIENSASEIHGAKVEIDNLNLSVFDLAISWDRLQIANPDAPMKNILETGRTGLNLEFMPLIRNKVVIDTIQFTDIMNNTDRTTSGKLVKKTKIKTKIKQDKRKEKEEKPGTADKIKIKVQSKAEDYKNFRLDEMKSDLNVDSLMLAVDLSSVEYIDSVKIHLEKRYKHWDDVIHSDEFQKDYDALEEEYNKLVKINPKKIKSTGDLKKALKKIKNTKKKFDKVNDKVKKYQKDFDKDLKNIKLAGSEIENKVNSDYKEIENVAKIPDIDTKNIASFVFGETVVNQTNKFFEITNKIAFYKKKLDKIKSEKEKPKRQKGKDIEFSGKYNYPDFWVKHIIFSGKMNNKSSIEGSIKDIATDSKLIDKATTASIKGKNPDHSQYNIDANIDTRTKKSYDTYDIEYSGFAVRDITVSKSAIFPYNIDKGKGKLQSNVKINRGKYSGKLNFYGTEMRFVKNNKTKSKTEIQKFLDQSVQKLTDLDVKCKFSNNKISINSNIDDIFNKEIKSYIDKNINKAKNEIRKEIDKEVGEKDAGLIHIFLEEKSGNVVLSIQDNGKGLPDGFSSTKSKGFGLMLVKILTKQIGGSFKIESNEGTILTLEFKV
jgi:uncharacterized protein (TIGR03545 family)